MLTATLI